MMTTIFAENLKKFRVAKGLTQEQIAEALHVNSQTVSRWECGTTLPDALTLPELAKLYSVTVDDFYKKHIVAYDNYAQRLASVYEMTLDPEDFLSCDLEYKKLMKKGELSIADKWNYAIIHHIMLCECKSKALDWYDRAIAEGAESNPHVYSRARSLRNKLLFELGRGSEVIDEQKKNCRLLPDNPREWSLLIEAHILAENFNEAYSVFREAIENFANDWVLYIHGGDICRRLKKYDEAFMWWDKAGEIGTDFHDEYYCKAYCYEDMGEYEKAYQTFLELADLLRQENFDVEAEMVEEDAQKIKYKILSN